MKGKIKQNIPLDFKGKALIFFPSGNGTYAFLYITLRDF
jgi:hypothetical protein